MAKTSYVTQIAGTIGSLWLMWIVLDFVWWYTSPFRNLIAYYLRPLTSPIKAGAGYLWHRASLAWRTRQARKRGDVVLGHLFLNDYDRVRHTHIVGTTGSGKTETTKRLIFSDIAKGRGCFIIDPKGDRELYEEVLGFCKSIGRENDLKLISATYADESCVWNPCGLGNASELQSKFHNSNVYSEPYYAKACEAGLIRAFNLLAKTKPHGFGINELTATLKQIAQAENSKTLEGLFYDFQNLTQSEWAPILGCSPALAKGREISLINVIKNQQILFVDLPTEGKSLQSSRVGRLLTQELILISGLKKSCPSLTGRTRVFSVFIDEFDAFATESFVTFLNKARSSGFMIHIIHQTLSDLKKISPEFMGQVLGLCNIHLIGIQHDPDDAELWARLIGTQTTVKQTYQTDVRGSTGRASNRVVEEFIISPNTIKRLGVGVFVTSVKTQNFRGIIQVPLPPIYGSEAKDQTESLMKGRTRNLAPAKEATNKWDQVSAPATELTQ
ncbi:MAG TPA: TraM recognition domain-containing protein [Bdellovibrionota bacterium]|nr:TraM recognition domain-containing protein [Bdellovibrionota bacterium]